MLLTNTDVFLTVEVYTVASTAEKSCRRFSKHTCGVYRKPLSLSCIAVQDCKAHSILLRSPTPIPPTANQPPHVSEVMQSVVSYHHALIHAAHAGCS